MRRPRGGAILGSMRLLLLLLLLAPCAPEARINQDAPEARTSQDAPDRPQLEPRTGEWWRYVLIAGLPRLEGDLRPEPAQARRLQASLRKAVRASRAADVLWPLAWEILDAPQQEFVRTRVVLPDGVCPCPCASWNPLLKRLERTLAQRVEGELPPPAPLPQGPAPEDDSPGGLQLVQGLVTMDAHPALRLRPEQARALAPILLSGVAALRDIEVQMNRTRSGLSREQARWMEEHGNEWLAGRTPAELEELWEPWEAEALAALQPRP